jgi:hypothetical protein
MGFVHFYKYTAIISLNRINYFVFSLEADSGETELIFLYIVWMNFGIGIDDPSLHNHIRDKEEIK